MSKWRPSQKLLDKLKRASETIANENDHLPHARDIHKVDPLTGDTPLHAAVSGESLKELDHLIRRGANLNAVDEDGLTPLMCACSWGGVKGMKMAIRLINAGADVNFVRVDDEMTALCFAACNSRPEVIQALLDRGAQVEGPPGAEQTPLMLAARENNVEAIKLLVAAGADVNRPCQLPWAVGRTAEWLAEQEGAHQASVYLRSLR